MANALPSYINAGTATVAANGTAVTGQGTSWLTNVRPGDMFGTHKGAGTRIAAVNSNTSLTLAYPWLGGAQTAAAYEISITPDTARMQETTRGLLETLTNGNLEAFAGLTLAADSLPYATGAGAMGLTPLTAFARSLLDDADAAAARTTLGANDAANLSTGTLPDARVSNTLSADKAYRRGNLLGTVSQSGGVPTGAVIERSDNANGRYVRFADGTQICVMAYVTVSYTNIEQLSYNWLFPAAFASPPEFIGVTSINSGASYIGIQRTSLGHAYAQYNATQAAVGWVRSYNAPNFVAGNEVQNQRLVAIGKWY